MVIFNSKMSSEKGFSLIEMMISIVIFLLAVAMIFQLMSFGIKQRNFINNRVDSVKGARIALSYIRRDLINAGLSYHGTGGIVPDNFTNKTFKAAADADTAQDFLTGITVGNNVSANSLNTGNNMDAIGLVTRDFSFNGGNSIDFTSTSASGNKVIVQTVAGGTVSCNVYDLYLFTLGTTTQVVGMVTEIDASTNRLTLDVFPNDPLGINLAANGVGNALNPLVVSSNSGTFKKINFTVYSIDSTGNLIRTTYGNQKDQLSTNQIVSSPIISNVKDFQLRYLLDDGTFTDDPTNGNNGRANQSRMNKVIEVEVTITVLQDSNSNAPETVKEVISTRNLQYKEG